MTVPPGSTIGIVGGGQLGRMLAVAASQLGYKAHIYAPDEAPPAAEVAAAFTRGDWADEAKLTAFGRSVDVVTYEFENIPAASLAALAGGGRLLPPVRALEVAQDRLAEKRFIEELGGKPARYVAVDDLAGLEAAVAEIGVPAVLKTRRFGYDGKGQARIMAPEDAAAAWEAVGGQPSILEAFVDFAAEFSILLCRGLDGDTVAWDPPRNVHKEGILSRSEVPGGPEIHACTGGAVALAQEAADALGYVGVLAMEFFATAGGPLFNEMAPRVHNSGHWTIEGAVTSQFENHIRAICGLPLGSAGLAAPAVTMQNLIGEEAEEWERLLGDRTTHLHLYGKGEGRPGRKMGHVTRLLF